MKLLVDDEIKIEDWNQLLEENKFSSPFQSFEYYQFMKSLPDITANAFAVDSGDGLLALCVISILKEKGVASYFSRRAIVYSGPLIKDGEEGMKGLEQLLDGINSQLKGSAIYGETYNFFNYSDYKHIFESKGWTYYPHYNVKIPIRDSKLEDILSTMKYNRRREIKMSLKAGAYIKEAEKSEEIADLYHILVDLYKSRVKLPLPSLEFFQGFKQSTIGKVLLVMHEDRVIGGCFCVFLPNKSIYTYYYCGLRDYHKSIFPAHLAVYAAIEFAVKNNLHLVDLMGAGKPDKEYGVRESKMRFGGDLVEEGRYKIIFNQVLFKVGVAGLKLTQKLSLSSNSQ
ncbi:MAG: GNAT family N-acetyltransferase [Bacteroidetes bacterium]|nr:GNAT family N-acetyltransferase [Bacteroidota bacterium]